MNYLIGIDLGTSSTKTILFDSNGNIVTQDSQEYPLYSPRSLWVEQDPKDWEVAIIKTIKNVIEKSMVNVEDIRGIGISGQMHGLVMLDNDDKVIRNSIIWSDGRTKSECNQINSIIGYEKMIKITGNPALTGFTLSKLLWIRNHEYQNYLEIKKILLPKDYVRFVLTSVFATDYSDASGTNMLDINKLEWSRFILDSLDIDQNILPKLMNSHEIVGGITKEVSERTGLLEGTPVVAGAADNAASAVGIGVIDEGQAFISIGTSGVIFSPTNQPKIDETGRVHTFISAVNNKWANLSCTLSAGQAAKWYRNNFFEEEISKFGSEYNIQLDELISKIPIGSNKLIFLPYLMGERSPILDEKAKACFIGLTNSHNKYDMYRAVLEGVSFSQKQCLDIVSNMNVRFKKLRIGGGGSTSKIWTQMLADTLNYKIETSESSDIAALGAAILAGVGTGLYENIDFAVKKIVKTNGEIGPSIDANHKYMKLYDVYDGLYLNLKQSFDKLSNI